MRRILLFSLMILMVGSITAQSRESADTVRSSLQAGVEFSVFNPDWSCSSSGPFTCGNGNPLIKGIGAFGNYDLHGKYGAEAEARWLHWDGVAGEVESTYLIGPRYRLYRWENMELWAKFLLGVGSVTTAGFPAPDTLKGTMFAYAPGATIEYPLGPRLSVRADYEFQKWPSFAVAPPHNHGLTPNGFSLGVAYNVFKR